jgi:hypothetical protein
MNPLRASAAVTRPPHVRGTAVGSHAWSQNTGGQLTTAEQLSLLAPLARAQVVNAAGRASRLLKANAGRRADIEPGTLLAPNSALTRAAEQAAFCWLTPTMLNHGYRTFAFGAAIGELEHITVDRELLFAAALLHGTGLPTRTRNVDFTLASARVARDVAEEVGLSSAATETVRTAITLHHSPGITRAHGAVAYLISAGAPIDVVGFRSWRLPAEVLTAVVEQHPRLALKRKFADAIRTEAARVPTGRVSFLRRFGAFDLAIQLAPFRE